MRLTFPAIDIDTRYLLLESMNPPSFGYCMTKKPYRLIICNYCKRNLHLYHHTEEKHWMMPWGTQPVFPSKCPHYVFLLNSPANYLSAMKVNKHYRLISKR